MRTRTILMIAGVLVSAWNALAMGQDSVGPDANTVNQPGWANGVVNLARHPARVYSRWINGNEAFYFKTDRQGIDELLRLYSECTLRDYEVRVLPGAGMVSSFDKKDFEYNVSLQVLGGIALFAHRRSESGETHEPVLTVYVGEGLATLEQLRLPANLLVQCEVPGARIKTGSKPVRKAWHGLLHWTEGGPAADMEHGLTTRITLWTKASPDGIEVATGDRDGFFWVPFSDKEMVALRSGETWLTAKAGNYLSTASKQDARIPADSLRRRGRKQRRRGSVLRPTISAGYCSRMVPPRCFRNRPGPGPRSASTSLTPDPPAWVKTGISKSRWSLTSSPHSRPGKSTKTSTFL